VGIGTLAISGGLCVQVC
jgi:hypothetical protein